MSRENVEALRSAYDGWAVGDMSAGMGLFDADVVYISDDQEPSPAHTMGSMRSIAAPVLGWRT